MITLNFKYILSKEEQFVGLVLDGLRMNISQLTFLMRKEEKEQMKFLKL